MRSGKVKAAGSTQGEAQPEAAQDSGPGSVEWEFMWDEVINGIHDGMKLDKGDA